MAIIEGANGNFILGTKKMMEDFKVPRDHGKQQGRLNPFMADAVPLAKKDVLSFCRLLHSELDQS